MESGKQPPPPQQQPPPPQPPNKQRSPLMRATSQDLAGVAAAPWPADFQSYQLLGKVGQGAFASVWRSECTANGGRLCAIKVLNLEHVESTFIDIRLEMQTMRLSSHPNILVCYTSFIQDTNLWLVTKLMNKGSSLHCIQSARTQYRHKRLEDCIEQRRETPSYEKHITYILHETILGLKYIHDNGQIHRDVKSANILLDSDGNVCLADFGVSGWLVSGGKKRENTRTFVGTPCWMAPEVMEQIHGYDYKADIWSLGITALELAKGYAPYAKCAAMKVLLMTIQEDPPSLDSYTDEENEEQWSESFRSMTQLCLQKDPRKRPTCDELLSHPHFKPLADPDVHDSYRTNIQVEICDIINDVGLSTSDNVSSQQNVMENKPICVVTSTEDNRPEGTTWVFSDGSKVQASSHNVDLNNNQEFFDQFERTTQGEHFIHPSVAAKHEETKQEKDDLNDFMDNFENTTGGENFYRRDE